MKRWIVVLAVVFSLAVGTAHASETVTIAATQVGGFYDGGGTPDNLPHFQNYYVGYGTSPGHGRTGERRSFFVFDLSGIAGTVESATLTLRLPEEAGLIFGKGPGDPETEEIPSDPFETFALGATHFPSAFVTSPDLPSSAIMTIFDSMDAVHIADPVTFMMGDELPPGEDGGPPEIKITLDGTGLFFMNERAGSEIVLTGWMPTWSYDDRLAPDGPTEFFEAHEYIFGHTDVHLDAALKPKLTVVYAPVPAPGALLTTLVGAVPGVCLLLRRRRWKATP
jgi:hypothetical protein